MPQSGNLIQKKKKSICFFVFFFSKLNILSHVWNFPFKNKISRIKELLLPSVQLFQIKNFLTKQCTVQFSHDLKMYYHSTSWNSTTKHYKQIYRNALLKQEKYFWPTFRTQICHVPFVLGRFCNRVAAGSERSLRHAQRKAFLYFPDKPCLSLSLSLSLSLFLCLPITNHRRKWDSSWFSSFRFVQYPSAVVENLSNRSGTCFRLEATVAARDPCLCAGYTCCWHLVQARFARRAILARLRAVLIGFRVVPRDPWSRTQPEGTAKESERVKVWGERNDQSCWMVTLTISDRSPTPFAD